MTDPLAVDAAHFFDFVGSARVAVLLVSLHPLHAFSPSLARQLGTDHESIVLGTVDLRELVVSATPALRFLQQGLRSCGAPVAFGVVPGYCLIREGQMLAWDSGLPAWADVAAIARSALLGAVWSGVSQDPSFIKQAVQAATDQVAAQRIASRFRYVLESAHAHRQSQSDDSRTTAREAPRDELYWAYHILGVLPTATDREIHDAWRKRRMEAHPDQAAGDPEEFSRRSRISQEINRARDIIANHRAGRYAGRAH